MLEWRLEIVPAAEKEVRALPAELQARFLHIAELLERLGPHRVGAPHIRPLGGKLWEMRMRGRNGIARAIYMAASERRLIVLRAFVKKTPKTPRREIEIAARRMKGLSDE